MKDEIKAGDALDALVAERVLGWIWWRNNESGRRGLFPPEATEVGSDGLWCLADGSEKPFEGRVGFVPPYSTSIQSAWEVVDKLAGIGIAIQRCSADTPYWNVYYGEDDNVTVAETAPLAICLAALAAVKEKDQTTPSPPVEPV